MKTQLVAVTPAQNNIYGQLFISALTADAGDPFSITGTGGEPGMILRFGGPNWGPLKGVVASDGTIVGSNGSPQVLVYGTATASGPLTPVTVTVVGTVVGDQSCQFAPAVAVPADSPGIALLASVAASLGITQADFPATVFACTIPPFSQPVTTQIEGFVFLSEARAKQLAIFLGATVEQDWVAPWTPAGYPSLVGTMPQAWYLVLGTKRVLAGAVAYLIFAGTPTPDLVAQLTTMFAA